MSDGNHPGCSDGDLFQLCHSILMGTLYPCDTAVKRMEQILSKQKHVCLFSSEWELIRVVLPSDVYQAILSVLYRMLNNIMSVSCRNNESPIIFEKM